MRDSFAIERIPDAIIRYLFQSSPFYIGQRELFFCASKDGEGMIAHHTTMIMVINVARILIEQMFHLVATIHHQHQRGNGQFSTGTRRQIADTAFGIALDSGNKLAHTATLHSLSRLGIHLTGVLIRRIVGEVATDNEEVLVRKIRFQGLSYLFQFPEVVGGYNNRYDGWNLLEPFLQKRQLHFETMLPVMRFGLITKDVICG